MANQTKMGAIRNLNLEIELTTMEIVTAQLKLREKREYLDYLRFLKKSLLLSSKPEDSTFDYNEWLETSIGWHKTTQMST